MKPKTADAARGKWRGILLTLGVDQKYLTGKHCPCPMCGGEDRFRWDNQHGNGGFICGVCGAGSGFTLLERVNGWAFATAAQEVDRVLGNVDADPPRAVVDDEKIRAMKQRIWKASTPMVEGDPAWSYLASRVALPEVLPDCLRYVDSCPAPDGNPRPAMLALVSDRDGQGKQIHRTFLGDGGKADMPDPRAMMPGPLPEGGAVRLFTVTGEVMGIAEGMETALAAAARFNVPVWSAINAGNLQKFLPPANIRKVLIFGDNDTKFAGQAAAYGLAHKLSAQKGLAVEVHIPNKAGTDWAD